MTAIAGAMARGERSQVHRGIVVAGMRIEHELPVGWNLGPSPFRGWTDGREVAAPLRLRHQIGDGSGLRLVIDAPDSQESYFVDEAGELAVRFGPRRPGERDQWMRTVRAGHDYLLQYETAAECGNRQWRWQRTAVMYAIASRGDGLVAHACGFITPAGQGIAAPGASGAGKSTLAAQVAAALGSAAILSDDRVVLSTGGPAPRIWGTPWHSAAGHLSSADAPLGAIVLPARSDGRPATLRTLSAAAALPRLLRAVASPFWSGESMDRMLGSLDVLLSRVAVFEYSYTPGPGAADVLLRALE